MIQQNPDRPAPQSVTDDIVSLDVEYYAGDKGMRTGDEPYRWNDDALMSDNASSGYNFRLIKGTDRPSLHGLGRAFDINPRINPYIRYTDASTEVDPPGSEYNPGADGALFARHALVVFMKSRGWEWGGDWLPESGRTDYQHFEKPL